jgi:putative resolvase
MAGVKLSEWARANGVSRQSATRWFHAGVLPVSARKLATGTILVDDPVPSASGVAVYARVSYCGQRGDLHRQAESLAAHLPTSGIAAAKVVRQVGSGLNGRRTPLLGLLRDASVGTTVVAHRERLIRFGVEYLQAALAVRGRKLIVVEHADLGDDLVRDMAEILSSFCARLYRRRSAKDRAELAIAADQTDPAA